MKESAEERRARRVKEIIAEKTQKKAAAAEAARIAQEEARKPPPPPPPHPPPPPQAQAQPPPPARDRQRGGSSLGDLGAAPGALKYPDQLPPDLRYASDRATAVNGALGVSGLSVRRRNPCVRSRLGQGLTRKHDACWAQGWLHGLQLGGYCAPHPPLPRSFSVAPTRCPFAVTAASALSELGVDKPSDLSAVSDEELAGAGMRPVEKRKLRKAAERAREL